MAHAPAVGRDCSTSSPGAGSPVVVDLTALSFIDSSGIHALLRPRPQDGTFELVCPAGNVTPGARGDEARARPAGPRHARRGTRRRRMTDAPTAQARRPRLEPEHRLAGAARRRRARRRARLRLALDVGPPLSDRRRPARADVRGLHDAGGLGGTDEARHARADGRRQHVPQPGARRQDGHDARPHLGRPRLPRHRRRVVRDRAHRVRVPVRLEPRRAAATGSTRRSS